MELLLKNEDELDDTKKNNLLKYINSDIQTIITTTDLNNINKDII